MTKEQAERILLETHPATMREHIDSLRTQLAQEQAKNARLREAAELLMNFVRFEGHHGGRADCAGCKRQAHAQRVIDESPASSLKAVLEPTIAVLREIANNHDCDEGPHGTHRPLCRACIAKEEIDRLLRVGGG